MQLNQNRLTKSARRWLIPALSLVIAANLSGCSALKRQPESVSNARDKTPLALELPPPLEVNPVEWLVITPTNASQVFKSMQSENQDPVVFAITDDGYKDMSLSWAEIRNLIAHQRDIIMKYKQYYEPSK